MEGKSSVKEDGGASVQVEEEAFFAGTWVLDVCSWNCVFLTPARDGILYGLLVDLDFRSF